MEKFKKFEIRRNDDNVVDFLANEFFGKQRNIVEAASDRAYRDFCRTLSSDANGKSFSKIPKGEKSNMKKEIAQMIETRVTEMQESCFDQDSFDKWHEKTCDTIIKDFKRTIGNGCDLSYGQAQKWLNMTLKYLYMLSYKFSDAQLSRFHAVIDNNILDKANEIGVSPHTSWGRWSKWSQDHYVEYQKELRKCVKEKEKKSLFDWEFEAWNDSRRG